MFVYASLNVAVPYKTTLSQLICFQRSLRFLGILDDVCFAMQ